MIGYTTVMIASILVDNGKYRKKRDRHYTTYKHSNTTDTTPTPTPGVQPSTTLICSSATFSFCSST